MPNRTSPFSWRQEASAEDASLAAGGDGGDDQFDLEKVMEVVMNSWPSGDQAVAFGDDDGAGGGSGVVYV